MKFEITSVFFATLCILGLGFAGLPLSPALAAGDSAGTLTINIAGFRNDAGFAMISVVNSQKGYDDGIHCRKFKCRIAGGRVTQLVVDLEFGEYGISIYHDENENGKIDKRMFGIPVESYGFSNNARGRFGPPGYEEVKFMFNAPAMAISVEVQ